MSCSRPLSAFGANEWLAPHCHLRIWSKETHQSQDTRGSLVDLSTSTQHVFNLSALFAMTCFSHASFQDTRLHALPVAVRCIVEPAGKLVCQIATVLYGLRTELCRVVYADKLLL